MAAAGFFPVRQPGAAPAADAAELRVVPSTEPQREVWLADSLGREASLAYNESVSLHLRGELDHSPTVVSNDGTVAVVEDCMDDRIGVYRVADNSRVDTDDPARRLYTVALRKVDGSWKVESGATRPEPCTA